MAGPSLEAELQQSLQALGPTKKDPTPELVEQIKAELRTAKEAAGVNQSWTWGMATTEMREAIFGVRQPKGAFSVLGEDLAAIRAHVKETVSNLLKSQQMAYPEAVALHDKYPVSAMANRLAAGRAERRCTGRHDASLGRGRRIARRAFEEVAWVASTCCF